MPSTPLEAGTDVEGNLPKTTVQKSDSNIPDSEDQRWGFSTGVLTKQRTGVFSLRGKLPPALPSTGPVVVVHYGGWRCAGKVYMTVHRLNRGRIAVVGLMLLTGPFALESATARASESDLIQRMKAGGHVMMIRHARAPGTGDPANFQLGDCSTQRNLDDRGRAQAKAIGDWFRSKGITQARVFSSQWCRCLETAQLMKLGPVTELPALNSFYQRPQDRDRNLRALRTFLSKQPRDGPLVVLVTHHVTIQGIPGETVSSGEGVVLELQRDQSHSVIGRGDFGLE